MSIEAMKQARQIIWRYRHETPLGNQPHMIAYEADQTIERIDQAIAEAEKQEPVAGTYWACERCNFACDKDARCPECGHHTLVQHDFHPQPAQPKREWVGLTEDQRTDIRSRVQDYTPMDSVKYGLAVQLATEEALKEANQ